MTEVFAPDILFAVDRLPFPRYVQLYPTTRCNQHCYFCFNEKNVEPADIPYEKAVKLLDILSAEGIGEIDVMGGEPFLLHWMPDFIRTAVKRGMHVNVSTNGSTPDIAEKLAGIDPGRVTVGISLEGSDSQSHGEITGSPNFSSAADTMRRLAAAGFRPVVKTVINRRTMKDVQRIIDLVKGAGVDRYYLIHMDVLTHNRSLLKEAPGYVNFTAFFERTKEANRDIGTFRVNASCFERSLIPPGARCAGGVLKLSISPDGFVYPCNLFHRFPEFTLGNMFTDGLKKVWESRKLDSFRTFSQNACTSGDCRNRTECTGGCPAHNYFHYRQLNGMDIRCGQ